MNTIRWTLALAMTLGLLAGTGCSKDEEKIGRLEAKVEDLERRLASQPQAGVTPVVQGGATH